MERFKSIDFMTLFAKALVKAARFDFIGIWKAKDHYLLINTNQASDFNDLVDPGVIQIRIILGNLHLGELDETTRQECKYQARRYNENISLN